MTETIPYTPEPQPAACARCGAPFTCGVNAATPCWCVSQPVLATIDASLTGCLCPDCLAAALARQAGQ